MPKRKNDCDDNKHQVDVNSLRRSTRKRSAICRLPLAPDPTEKTNKSNIVIRNKKLIVVSAHRESIPRRNEKNECIFADFPLFKPNMTPKEVLQAGSFGGTYFRPIFSSITNSRHSLAWKEFPVDWFDGLDISLQISSNTYRNEVNTYKVKCGGDLHMWESSGWITEIDPYGWFQWYCRFYLGRRCSDDDRQISRAVSVMGPKGRWRSNLINKCLAARNATSKSWEQCAEDTKISPVIRQVLQHWGYHLTAKDLEAAYKKKK